jgi:hypothetical protein
LRPTPDEYEDLGQSAEKAVPQPRALDVGPIGKRRPSRALPLCRWSGARGCRSLHEAHALLSSTIDTAISDVFSKRAPLDDPDRQRRLEDAYAEVVSARPYLQQHIRCGRKPDGTFHGSFRPIPLNPPR